MTSAAAGPDAAAPTGPTVSPARGTYDRVATRTRSVTHDRPPAGA
ncbi:hypothetical protein [Kitasatospora sp. NPDC056184]